MLLVLAVSAWGNEIAEGFCCPNDSDRGREYAFHERQLRTEVASRYMRDHAIAMTPDFWTAPHADRTAAEVLREEVRRSMARVRAVQEVAREQGILDEPISYDGFVAAFHAENRRRRDMKAAGEVFYGPVEFRKEIYFQLWLDQIVREIRRRTADRETDLPRREREELARQKVKRDIDLRTETILAAAFCGKTVCPKETGTEFTVTDTDSQEAGPAN